jgi:predicted acyltransferase
LFEAHNLQAVIAAVEGMILLILTVVRWRWIVEAFKKLRSNPYVVYAAVFSLIFIIAFASFPNFGLLARQRVQLFPLLFVLFCIPPGGRNERDFDRAQSG